MQHTYYYSNLEKNLHKLWQLQRHSLLQRERERERGHLDYVVYKYILLLRFGEEFTQNVAVDYYREFPPDCCYRERLHGRSSALRASLFYFDRHGRSSALRASLIYFLRNLERQICTKNGAILLCIGTGNFTNQASQGLGLSGLALLRLKKADQEKSRDQSMTMSTKEMVLMKSIEEIKKYLVSIGSNFFLTEDSLQCLSSVYSP